MSTIDKAQVKTDIKAVFDLIKGKKLTQEQAEEALADGFAELISNAIQRGVQSATYSSGLVAGNVSVTGAINLTVSKQ
ncbi:MAG: hypothetical protein H6Q17_571 [Bacteroidetes bacterium]|nr:hypothetical protein [Bacteroidota bacterium]